MKRLLKRLSSARIIALGFAAVIFAGSGLLMLPCSVRDGVSLKYIDALYTSASAVCVTGLVTVDIGDTKIWLSASALRTLRLVWDGISSGDSAASRNAIGIVISALYKSAIS